MNKYFDNKELFGEPRVYQSGNNMVMTNVMKPTQKKIVCLDTKMCDDFQYIKSCSASLTNSTTITLPEPINEILTMRVKNMELPISMTNVSAFIGNISFSVINNTNGIKTSIVITDGNYTVSTLATEINTKLANAGLGAILNVNMGSTYTVFTLSATNANYTIDFSINADGVVDKYNFRNTLGWMLGFRNVSYTIISSSVAGSITAEAMRNLDGLMYVYLLVDEYNNGKSTDFVAVGAGAISPKNILAKISLDKTTYPFGSCLIANETNGLLVSNKRVYSNATDIQRLSVRLVDYRGINVNLNGRDYSFSIEVEHK